MANRLAFGFALLFAAVVAIGYVPAFVTVEGNERQLFGLFQLTLIDDITHGVTAVAALAASLASRRVALLFCTAFGFYYGLDAVFFLTYGFVNDKRWMADILLNLPHVGIAAVMLGYAYGLAPREPPPPRGP
jgi:arginine exporter protein ArgO